MPHDVKVTIAEKDAMDPFGWAWHEYSTKIEGMLAEMNSEELLRLQRSFAKLGQTNCWYATYHARPQVLQSISQELYRREVTASASGESGSETE